MLQGCTDMDIVKRGDTYEVFIDGMWHMKTNPDDFDDGIGYQLRQLFEQSYYDPVLERTATRVPEPFNDPHFIKSCTTAMMRYSNDKSTTGKHGC